jgi:hypothetical protein
MENKLTQALVDFKNTYPNFTIADIPAFILGYEACLDDNQSKDEVYDKIQKEDDDDDDEKNIS